MSLPLKYSGTSQTGPLVVALLTSCCVRALIHFSVNREKLNAKIGIYNHNLPRWASYPCSESCTNTGMTCCYYREKKVVIKVCSITFEHIFIMITDLCGYETMRRLQRSSCPSVSLVKVINALRSSTRDQVCSAQSLSTPGMLMTRLHCSHFNEPCSSVLGCFTNSSVNTG